MSKPLIPRTSRDVANAVEQALALHRQGRLDEAERIYGRVLKASPGHFDALHLCAMLKLQRGKAGEAYRLIGAALRIDPRSADALSNAGLVLSALKRDEEALASFEKALSLSPDHVEALNNRGLALLETGRAEEALASFERVLRQEPGHLEARINRGNALSTLERLDEALADYDAAIALVPAHPGAHFNRGNALSARRRHADAIAAYDRALALAPTHVKALNNRGLALAALTLYREALASYAGALAVQKDFADAHRNEAMARLTLGELGRGFEKYEWRWKRTGVAPRRFGQPLWRGEYPLGRKTILVHAEQGFGDTIQFARYARLLRQAGARVVLEVHPELKSLLAGLDGVAEVIGRGEKLPAFDVHCPVASLPLAFGTELATIPADIPYLTPDAGRLAKWRSRLAVLERPRVALAWSGRASHENDRNRSVALACLAPLLAVADMRFVGVQRDLRREDAEFIRRDGRIAWLGDELDDFADTAAVLALVDLVIAVDTSVVHVAGAMGRPTWVLLPFAPDWRWMLDREDSPWYPTVRLFRQPAIGDWDSVVARAAAELGRLAKSSDADPDRASFAPRDPAG
jgi:tetratricopeptide (TPR) repeat protein